MNKEREYPFNDGDDYWTVEKTNDAVKAVLSCWDDVSEEIHDNNPSQLYFKTQDEAIYYILKTNKKDKPIKMKRECKICGSNLEKDSLLGMSTAHFHGVCHNDECLELLQVSILSTKTNQSKLK